MRKMTIGTIVILLIAGTTGAANPTLWDKLIDVALQHIKTNGPDAETGQFIGMARHHAWSRRQEFVDLVIPYLKGKDPDKAAGAVDILHWLRIYRPVNYLGDFEKENHDFFFKADKIVYGQLEHLHSLENDQVYHRLAIYLGCSPTAEAKRHLLRIADSPIAKDAKEQALICLAWHRDEKDMESLFPFMLGESHAAWNLPYHFRNSYGRAALPYLKRALEEAESAVIRQRVAYELVHLRIPEGFRYLGQVALADPEPEERTQLRPLEGIRQFAVDYLTLPKDTREPAAIAAHIAKKERELCRSEDSGEEMSDPATILLRK
jgi:hypothetical protein